MILLPAQAVPLITAPKDLTGTSTIPAPSTTVVSLSNYPTLIT